MRLHVIMHESFEAPAAIVDWAQARNHSISYTKLFDNEKLPSNVEDFDFLVVMGGPQSPATTLQECPYFDANAESELISKAIKADKYVLGVCLGAQLIGEALDARFDHSPNREIGVFELKLTDAGLKDSIFSQFPQSFFVGHWHGDMPGLTSDSEILAYSEGCPRQIVRYMPKVYGFQCHFEFTKESVEGMIKNCSNELEAYKDLPYIQQAEVLRGNDYKVMNELLFKFLGLFIEDFK